MKTYKEKLTEKTFIYKNDNDNDILEVFYSEKINKFCLIFNGKFYTYKTYNGLVNKRNYFIEKYKLTNE